MNVIQRCLSACGSVLLSTCVAGVIPGLGPAPAAAQPAADRGSEQTEHWSRVFKVPQKGSLDLTSLAGDVVVLGGAGDEIRIDAVKRVRAKGGDENRALLEGLDIRVNEAAGRVEISTVFPRRHKVHAEIDFRIQVPFHAEVAVHTVSGDIRLEKVQGETRVESVSGDLTLTGIERLLRAKTVSGDLTVSGSGGDVVTGGTVSGDLIAKGLKANACDLQSVSGDVTVTESLCRRAQLRSISGGIEYAGQLAAGGRYEFNSHSGDVRLSVPDGSGFELVANTFSGQLQSDFRMSGTREGEPGRSSMPHRELRGTVGDGSAYVVVKTFSGAVTVTRSAPAPRR